MGAFDREFGIRDDGTTSRGLRVVDMEEKPSGEFIIVLRSKGGKYYGGVGRPRLYSASQFRIERVRPVPGKKGIWEAIETIAEFPVSAGTNDWPLLTRGVKAARAKVGDA